jgi:transposase
MAQVRSWAGLDVHVAKVVAATVDQACGELRVRRLSGVTSAVVEFCAELPAPVVVAYEAGPTGFGLARALDERGIRCVIAAPGKIARAPQDRVKTDRRDAERLVRLLIAGELHPVRVPSPAEEGLRDLVRAREDLRGDLMRARHRVGKLLLRHDLRFDGNNWTQRHRDWLTRVELVDPVAQAVLQDGVGSIDALLVRRSALERQMVALIPTSPWRSRSHACAVCAASTPSRRWGSAPRSATSDASEAQRS